LNNMITMVAIFPIINHNYIGVIMFERTQQCPYLPIYFHIDLIFYFYESH